MHAMRHLLYKLIVCTALAAATGCVLAVGGPGSPVCDSRGFCSSTGPCAGFGDASSCQFEGCAWGSTCGGYPTPCQWLDANTCQYQAGCGFDAVTGFCVGNVTPCEALGPSCAYQLGCQPVVGCFDAYYY